MPHHNHNNPVPANSSDQRRPVAALHKPGRAFNRTPKRQASAITFVARQLLA